MPNQNNDNFLKLLEKMAEIHSDVNVIKNEMTHIKEDVSKNTKDLEIHIQCSTSNKQRLELEIEERKELSEKVIEVDSRVSKLEITPKVLKYIKNFILVLGSIAAAIFGIIKLFNIKSF